MNCKRCKGELTFDSIKSGTKVLRCVKCSKRVWIGGKPAGDLAKQYLSSKQLVKIK